MTQSSEPVLRRINALMQLRQEVESLAQGAPWVPPADWIETDTELALVMDLPGVDQDKLELALEQGAVTVRGERATLDLNGAPLTSERPQGQFQRSLKVPAEIVQGSGDAQLRAGVLVVRFEKRHKIIDHG